MKCKCIKEFNFMCLDDFKTTIEGDGLIKYELGEIYECHEHNDFILVNVDNINVYAFDTNLVESEYGVSENEHLFKNHFVIIPDNSRVEELFEIIKKAQDELTNIRENCKHEKHSKGTYSWRIGSYQTGQICDYCKEFLGDI